jgi:hypothetical protein
MEISSTASAPAPRSVTPSKSSSDKQSYDQQQVEINESKAQERTQEQRAIQEKLQQNKDENQRRLDGRLITFGHEKDNVSSEQKQASFNRSRVKEAYSPPNNDLTNAHKEQHKHMEHEREAEAIDIVV